MTQFASFSSLADNLQKGKDTVNAFSLYHTRFLSTDLEDAIRVRNESPNINECVVQAVPKFTNKNMRQFTMSSSIILYFQSQNLKIDKEGNFNLFVLIIKIERPLKWVLLDFRI